MRVRIGGGVGRAIYERAFHQVTGRPLNEPADMSGRTDQAVITGTLRLSGIAEPEALLTPFHAALADAAAELAGRMHEFGSVLPGARQAITECAARRAVQSAVTGNLRPIAPTKLSALGLAEGLDFTVGGYGDDGTDRSDLVRRARKRASQKYGHTFKGKRTIVVGDTPHDIRGALDAHALAVGVASGTSTPEELRAAGADIVLADLTEFTSRCGESRRTARSPRRTGRACHAHASAQRNPAHR